MCLLQEWNLELVVQAIAHLLSIYIDVSWS